MWMTWKTSLMGLPFGGAKGGVSCNSRDLSPGELEHLTRRYTYAIYPLIGPEIDIPAPDVGTNAQTMAWIMDTYSMQTGIYTTGVVTGKPASIGGSLGREEATGLGVVNTILEAAKKINLKLENAVAVVQGFGNVGYNAAKFLQRRGVKVVAVSNSLGGVYNAKGLPIEDLHRHSITNHDLRTVAGVDHISNEELLALKCDILVLAALENAVTDRNAAKVDCRIYAEGANGPTSLEADRILMDKGVFMIPDILCNSGGVVVSYFEWVQDLQNFFWDEDMIHSRMEKIMGNAFHATYELAQKEKVCMRTAALMLGIKRVAESTRLRGLYP
jgi:glutamate dehydrogenase (NAD(P)+)